MDDYERERDRNFRIMKSNYLETSLFKQLIFPLLKTVESEVEVTIKIK